MKYKASWKGKLRVSNGKVLWEGQEMGTVKPRWVEGATSPGGMVTNMVYIGVRRESSIQKLFTSMTDAIAYVLREGERPSATNPTMPPTGRTTAPAGRAKRGSRCRAMEELFRF